MSKPDPAVPALRAQDLQLEIVIQAPPDRVWRALTDDIARWWPSAFYCGSGAPAAAGRRRFVLEARPGGRMWEDWGDGEGLLWATVTSVVNGKNLELAGTISPAWGGPATLYSTFTLTAEDGATRLRYAESAFGRLAEGADAAKATGWRFLLDGALRAHCEGKPAPEWQG